MWCERFPRTRESARRLLRWFTLGSGPLKRASDRLQLLSRCGVVVLLLAAVPVALAMGTVTRSQLDRVAARQSAERHEVTATLVADAPLPIGPQTADVPTAAVWAGRDGVVHDVQVPVVAGSRAGEVVTVWLDRAGEPTQPPLSSSDMDAEVVIRATLVLLGVIAVAACAHLGLASVLDRHRARQWAAEWAAIEPRWAGRVR